MEGQRKKIKRSDYDSAEEFVKAFREERMRWKKVKKKRKWNKYQRIRYKELTAPKKRKKESEKRKKKKEEEDLKKHSYVRLIEEQDFDFLKYRFIVDKYFKRRHFKELTPQEFEIVLFIYSEPPFTKQFFDEFTRAIAWNKHRIEKFLDLGIVRQYEQKHEMIDKRFAIRYTITNEYRNIVKKYYKALVACYELPTYGDMFKKKSQSYIEMKMTKLVDMFNTRVLEYQTDTALSQSELSAIDLDQKTFKEIYAYIKDLE